VDTYYSGLGFKTQYTVPDGIKGLVGALKQNVFDLVDTHRNFYGNYKIDY
jgi:hypothetical protein